MKIIVKKGSDLPLEGCYEAINKEEPTYSFISADFSVFDLLPIELDVRVGDKVEIGSKIAHLKNHASYTYVSPASGIISNIIRGEKRKIRHVIIKESTPSFINYSLPSLNKNDLWDFLLNSGILPHIKMRPFNIPALSHIQPNRIFVNLAEKSPLNPIPENQLLLFNSEDNGIEVILKGLEILNYITPNNIHVIVRSNSQLIKFLENTSTHHLHTIEGPYPSGNTSVMIQKIAPIKHDKDFVWVFNMTSILTLGNIFLTKKYFINRMISICGPDLPLSKRVLQKTRLGAPIKPLLSEIQPNTTLIAGGVLIGKEVCLEDFLGFFDTSICNIRLESKREFLHFMRLGTKKFTLTKTYLSSFFHFMKKRFSFTTNQHGECRPFVDTSIYNKVMPLNIPTILLIKAILTEDYEKALELGFLEICEEDFALSSFICPSKNNLNDIVKQGINKYIKDNDILSISN